MKKIAPAIFVVFAALWYVRDPAWLDAMTSGLRPWEQSADGHRYRWSGGHASFFVPSSAASFDLPLSTMFGASDPPMVVTITVDDRPANRLLLTDADWHVVTVTPSAPTTRRVRRVDVRAKVTRDGNYGVRIGEIALRSTSLGSAR